MLILSLIIVSVLLGAQSPPFHFATPPGPLDAAIAAFHTGTGLTVTLPVAAGVGSLPSPGVTGDLTADAALDRLLAGLPLAARRSTAGGYALDFQIAPEQIDVVGRAPAARPETTATATRTITPLRDVPQTITVVPRDLLTDQNAQSLAAAMKNVPGVSVAQGEGNRDQVVIRGISTASDFFVNGVRDDQERFRDLYNVEGIEVLQGPAAVLFGRGGAGGVVNLVTRRPSRAPSDVVLDLGTYGHKRATA